jgi:hypothetical protein
MNKIESDRAVGRASVLNETAKIVSVALAWWCVALVLWAGWAVVDERSTSAVKRRST